MQLKVKKLYKDVKLPSYSRKGDAGIDLFAHTLEFVKSTQIKYGTGIAMEIPTGYVGLLIQRSNTVNRGIRLSNCVGVIDSNFRGEILVYFSFNHRQGKLYHIGDKVAQIVIVPCPTFEVVDVRAISDSARQGNGFGSSDAIGTEQADVQVSVPEYTPRSDGTDR
jgi:dUTP pyrophosphatase